MLACLVSYVTRKASLVTRLEFVRTSGRGASQAVRSSLRVAFSFHPAPVITAGLGTAALLINGRHDGASWTYAVCKHVAPER
jgi:hypothetical protein